MIGFIIIGTRLNGLLELVNGVIELISVSQVYSQIIVSVAEVGIEADGLTKHLYSTTWTRPMTGTRVPRYQNQPTRR